MEEKVEEAQLTDRTSKGPLNLPSIRLFHVAIFFPLSAHLHFLLRPRPYV